MAVLEVDRKGLAKKLSKRPKSFIIFELAQNSWDEDVRKVAITAEMLPGRPVCRVAVEDDCPEGFSDLRSVYTMFRDSKKAPDPTKRGRFELGEKMVLALAISARITTTKGTIQIEGEERRHSREKRDVGTIFEGEFRMNREEFAEVCQQVRRLIPPAGIETTFNGELLQPRTPVHTFETTLQTIRVDDEGNLSPTMRKAEVRVYDVLPGEEAHIYEMGIPVVATGDKWHYDVQQRVPVNWERNNVPPSYLRTLRVEVLNALHDRVDREEAASVWVTQAAQDERVTDDAVKAVVVKRFGKKAVSFDPSDPEGNKIAITKGYTVIPGGSLPKPFWDNVRRSKAVLPAGQVTPSPKPYHPNGRPEHVVDESDWTPQMRRRVDFCQKLFQRLIGQSLTVYIVREPTVFWVANFGGGTLCLNLGKLGHKWFAAPNRATEVLDLLLHEFVHHTVSDHLSHEMHKEATRLGALLANICLDSPSLFMEP